MLDTYIQGGVSPEGVPLIRISLTAHFTLEQANDIANALKQADIQAALALGSVKAPAHVSGPADAAEGEPVALHQAQAIADGVEFKPDPAIYDLPGPRECRPLLYDDTDCGCGGD